jgi:hypothetical protein
MTSFGHNTLASPPCVYSVVLDGFLLVWLTVSNARFRQTSLITTTEREALPSGPNLAISAISNTPFSMSDASVCST